MKKGGRVTNMIPSFSCNNINFITEDGKYIGLLNFIHTKAEAGSRSKNKLEGSVRKDGLKEYPIDVIIFGCSFIGTSLRIEGVNNHDRKIFRLNVTLKFGITPKCKIEGNYGSRTISMVTDLGIGAVMKIFEIIISSDI
jgi:hypothetical protein